MILRVLICIPTYNNESTIESVVLDSLRLTDNSILVVDDGSSTAVTLALRDSRCREALHSGRLRILRHERKRGKGCALQTGLQWAVRQGFTHLLSGDGDGQHLLREAGKLIAKAVEHPWDLVIGIRRLDMSAEVPGLSK